MGYYGTFNDYFGRFLDRKIMPRPIILRCNNCGVVLIRLNEEYLECPKCNKSYYVR